jgi:uncharacterized protein (TIGR02145 family)
VHTAGFVCLPAAVDPVKSKKAMKRFILPAVVLATLLLSCKPEHEFVLSQVVTDSVSGKDLTHLLLYGEVTDEGSDPVTRRGFCWNFTGSPTLEDHTSDNGSGVGTFNQQITVMPDTTYHIRAYAESDAGVAYGVEITGSTTLFGSVTDVRDGRSYQTVIIGDQVWMAENLAWLPAVAPVSVGGYTESFYYVEGYDGTDVAEAKATANYLKYGVLYNERASWDACPDGWHRPSDDDWKILEGYLGMEEADLDVMLDDRLSGSVGWKLKSVSGWAEDGNGIDSCGFNALPGGNRGKNGNFGTIGMTAGFWTSTPAGSSSGICRVLSFDSKGIKRTSASRNVGYSIRCVKNK